MRIAPRGIDACTNAVREERSEQAALAALIRVARLVEVDRLDLGAVDAVLQGEWRLALTLTHGG